MNVLRWIASFHLAFLAGMLALAAGKWVLPGGQYGGGLFPSLIGLVPLALEAALPTAAFAVVGPRASPSNGRTVGFVYFGLALFLSAGRLNSATYQEIGAWPFWRATEVGIVIGGLFGLWLSLNLQMRRQKKPNQSLQHNAGDRAPMNVSPASETPSSPAPRG